MLKFINGRKAIVSVVVLFFVFCSSMPYKVAQASLRDILIGGAVQYFFLREVLLYEHYNQHDQILNSFKKEYGENKDERANKQLNETMTNLIAAVAKKEKIKPTYSWFVNKQKSFNAFCGLGHTVSVNIGLFEYLNYNEDELAFVLAHEMVHGQRMHAVSSLNKAVPFLLAAQLYNEKNSNTFSYIVSAIVTKQLIANYATLPQEQEADRNSFGYAVDAGYNPGAGAAVWARVLAKEGNKKGNFFENVINPNDHPSHAQREEYFSQRLTEYSGGKVKVSGGIITINGQEWLKPVATDNMLAVERAYFIAGNLARAIHYYPAGKLAGVSQSGEIMIGEISIIKPLAGDGSAQELASSLNKISGL